MNEDDTFNRLRRKTADEIRHDLAAMLRKSFTERAEYVESCGWSLDEFFKELRRDYERR